MSMPPWNLWLQRSRPRSASGSSARASGARARASCRRRPTAARRSGRTSPTPTAATAPWAIQVLEIDGRSHHRPPQLRRHRAVRRVRAARPPGGLNHRRTVVWRRPDRAVPNDRTARPGGVAAEQTEHAVLHRRVVGHGDGGTEHDDARARSARGCASRRGSAARPATGGRARPGRSCRPDRWPWRGPSACSTMSSLTTPSMCSAERHRAHRRGALRGPPGPGRRGSPRRRPGRPGRRRPGRRPATAPGSRPGRADAASPRACRRCGRRRRGRPTRRTATGRPTGRRSRR